MRIAIMLEGQEGITWEQWLALARAAEAAELDGLFRSDHYLSIHRGPPAGGLDAWVTLGALAAHTRRLRLGTLVSPVTFRHVAVLAKSAVSVDRISAGRVELGIGTGWFEPEHAAYGIPFMSTRERFDELERQLAQLHHHWDSDADLAQARPDAAPPGNPRRSREPSFGCGGRPLRGRIQHRRPVAGRGPRASADRVRRSARGGP